MCEGVTIPRWVCVCVCVREREREREGVIFHRNCKPGKPLVPLCLAVHLTVNSRISAVSVLCVLQVWWGQLEAVQ